MQDHKQITSLSASSTDMVRLKQGGKRGAIAAEAAARKEDLEIPDVPKSDDDLKMIGARCTIKLHHPFMCKHSLDTRQGRLLVNCLPQDRRSAIAVS
jgi:hypothetical protein